MPTRLNLNEKKTVTGAGRRLNLSGKKASKPKDKYQDPEWLKAHGWHIGDGSLGSKIVSNITEGFIGAPGGLYEVGKAAALDTRDISRGLGGREGGDLTPTRSRDVGKAIARSTYDTVRHPLRRPGDSLLLALGGYGALASGTSRVASASAALKAGKGAKAAIARPGYKGGSLLHKPAPEPRYRKVGDMTVRSRYSTSPGFRGIQKGMDKLEERFGDKGLVEARNIRKTGKELGFNRVVDDAAMRAPAKRLARMGKRLSKPQMMAARIWGQGLTIDQKIAQHKRAISELADADLPPAVKQARTRKLNERIALTEAARPYMDGTEIAKAFKKPRRGATSAQLAAFTRQADRVAGNKPGGRERVLLEAGVIEPGQITFRKNAPGRLALGAQWSTAAEHAVKRLDEIDRQRRDLIPDATVVPGKKVKTVRKRTREEAEARLADLDSVLGPLMATWATEVRRMNTDARKGGGGAVKDKYDNWIDQYGKQEGSRIAGLPDEDRKLEGFVQGERRGYAKREKLDAEGIAEEMLSQVAGREPLFEIDVNALLSVYETLREQGVDMAKLRAALDERDELRGRFRAAEPTPEEALGEAPPREPDFGEIEAWMREPDKLIAATLEPETIAALESLSRLEMQAFEDLARGDVPKLVGAEDFTGGRARIPDVPTKEPRKRVTGSTVYRGGQPATPKSLKVPYSGALEASGDYRINLAHELAASALEAGKFTSLLSLRKKIIAAGVKARPEDSRLVQWVPVREQRLTAKQRRMLAKSEPDAPSETAARVSPDERKSVDPAWQAFLEDVFPEKEYANVQVGEVVPNVVWVPRQLLTNMNRPFASSYGAAALAGLDTVLNLVKFAIVPLKPAYVTANAIGNMTFNLVQQGVMLPRNWKQATTLLRDERTSPLVREVMGSGGMSALLSGNPKGVAALNAVFHKYGDVAAELMLEPMMRVSALVHEARRMGYKSNAQIYRVLTDAKHADDRAEIVRRAKDAIIDYDRLGPLERSIARRALFIYPWVKGATVYAGHFLMEHPIQAGATVPFSEIAREKSYRDLGPLPSYARGSFKVGGSDDFPLVVNPATISPVSQAAEIASVGNDWLFGGGGSADRLGGLLHPALEALLEAANKRDSFTGRAFEGPGQQIFLEQLLGATAPAVLYQGVQRADEEPGNRSYPMTKEQAILRFLLGSFMPRTANRQALNKSAGYER